MYEAHFGLARTAFALTPDTEFFYAHPAHLEALQVLQVALAAGEGFIKITGEVGTGKTLLCRSLLNRLQQGWVTAYLPNPQLSAPGLRQAIAAEIGLPQVGMHNDHRLVQHLQIQLIELARRGLRVAVVVDEAQALSDQGLEALRLISNLETEKTKLLQVVLFGQPELDRRLAAPHLRQLRQRIGFSYRLRALDREAVGAYVGHRLRIAGHADGHLFSAAALRRLHRASAGVPRLINLLAHKSLMLAYGRGDRWVQAADVDHAAGDTESARSGLTLRWPRWPRWLPLALPALLVGAWWGLWR